MSRLLELIGVVAFGAGVCLLWISSAHAQAEPQPHMPTIADCPPGYVLAVQDTGRLLPLARENSDANPNSYAADGSAVINTPQQDADYAAAQAQAPHAFVTGCVLPQQQQ